MTGQAISDTYRVALAADNAYDVALKAAGYKSRWDWSRLADPRPDLLAAYNAKVAADEAHHVAWEKHREYLLTQ